MPKAKLEVLGLEVPTGLFTAYHDDGFVDSLEEHALELVEQYFTRTKRKYNTAIIKADFNDMVQNGVPAEGMTMAFNFFRSHIHIFYLNLPPESSIRVRAHEETHVLEELGHLNTLAEKILREQRVKVDFNRLDDSEVRAGIGAVYALHAQGIDSSRADVYVGSSFKKALDIYEQSRLGE